MQTGGMRPADAPGRGLLGGASLSIPGNALTVICEGVRPLALEVQALAVKTPFAMPRRTASGFDASRLHLLLAVLQKRADVDLSKCDVYLNVVGGVQLSDPGADLAVAMAIAASNQDRPLPPACVILGELGLGGEIRRVHRLEARLREAAALGVNRVVVPVGDAGGVAQGLRCTPVETVTEAMPLALVEAGSYAIPAMLIGTPDNSVSPGCGLASTICTPWAVFTQAGCAAAAARLAEEALGSRWAGLIARSLAGKHDSADTPDSDVNDTVALIQYTVGRFRQNP